jgi:5-hydroxyisourate hydrolase-like protein (transthyretin family)
MSNQIRLIFFKNIFPFLLIFVIFSCANRQLPQGGPRDRTPPKLLKATPENSTRNFKAKQIRLDFDEFIKLANQNTEITLTPTPVKTPEYNVRKKSLIIDLKDTLEKNTTYVINFGKAIQDVNEGNILKNFTYVFSTGIHIDSLGISGTVINNETLEYEKDATVMLFTLKQDSLLFGKKRPTVYTTTDSAGNFSLNNLHPGIYRLYALKEKTANKIYDNDNELIAFLKKDLHLRKDTSNVQLRLFKQTPEKFRLVDRRFDADGKMFFSFNRPLDNPSLQIVYPNELNDQKIVDINKNKDTVALYMKNMNFDSIRVAFLENGKPLDSTSLRKGKKETFQRTLLLHDDLNDGKLKPGAPFIIGANYPIDNYETALMSLKEDSTDVTTFTITRDTGNLKSFNLKYRWKQNSNYTLTFEAGAFTNIYGDKNKRQQKKFMLDKPENYSQLTLSVTVPDTGKTYVVQLLNFSKVLVRSTVIHGDSKIVYKNFITGKYYVSVVYDDNNNGKWDSGNLKKRTQPEYIWVNKDAITLRPNWEQETPITIPREPITH